MTPLNNESISLTTSCGFLSFKKYLSNYNKSHTYETLDAII